MAIFERNNFRWIPAIRLVGVALVLLLYASSSPANSGDVAATVTVAPRVEALTASAIPLGSSPVNPGQKRATLLAFSLTNTYIETKSLTTLAVRDATRGVGTPAQLLSNIDSLFLFRDMDGDRLLTGGDSLLVSEAWDASNIVLTLGALDIDTDSSITFLVAVDVALFARDGDSLDAFLRPASDIATSDATPVSGPDSVNSLGFGVIDGLVAAQLNTPATGLSSIGTGDTVYNVFTVDIPRNGYTSDTLRSFTIHNSGTADENDLEFVVLFSDNGNGVWGGITEENLIAPLEYIGAHWAASDLNVPLTNPTTRFYLGAKTLPYPVNGSTLILSVPEYGLLVASRNDGPLDTETTPVDTTEIQSEQGLLITSYNLGSGSFIPGTISEPVFAIELSNGTQDVVQIDSLDLQLALVDPDGGATVPELESQFDSLIMYLDGDGDPSSISGLDVAVASTVTTNGECRFSPGGLPISAGGGEVSLSVVLVTNLDFAKDGNTADMSLSSESDVFVSPGTTIFGNFPVEDAAIFTVDAFPAEKIVVNTISARNLYGGQVNIPILDFYVPGNGYASDTLRAITVENIGTVEDDIAVDAVKLWSDQLDDGYTGDDVLVASLSRGVNAWTAAGFSQFVPAVGQRLILTVDISVDQFDGGTLALSIPVGGLTYASGMTGPDDQGVSDVSTHLIVPPQRITVVSVPTASMPVRPGQTKNTLLTFAIYNGYINETKTLRTLRFRNISRSVSDADFADHEIGGLRLYYDADANRLPNGDPLIGSGYFQDGVLAITGLTLALPSESLAYFFVQSDVAIDAIDSDSLGININGIADIVFQETVSINGDLPLTSGGWHIVDGSVKSQYEILALSSQSVNPGETLVPLMSFRPASNGDQIDTLVSVSVANLGTADTTDITNLKLWIDSNGDDAWQVTDALIGSFAYTGSWWGTGGFAVTVPPTAPTLFVTGDIQPGGTEGRTVNLMIPLTGCLYASDNDGPLDSTLSSGAQFTLAGSDLRITLRPNRETYSVGEKLEVVFWATNLSGSVMDSVIGLSSLIGSPSVVNLDSVQLGPTALPSLDSVRFASYYTAMEPGTVSWSLQAAELVSDDSSSELTTAPCYVQSVPTAVDIDFVSSMPATVTLGQKNVIPMSLSFIHGDTSSSAASARLDSLSLQIYDGNINDLPADAVFARLRLITDEMKTVSLVTIPSSPEVTFVFTDPIIVEPGSERSLSVVVDIDSLATATDFALAVTDESSVIFRDYNSGVEVPVTTAGGFPLVTTVGRIDRPPDQLLVGTLDQIDQSVNLGQVGARLLRLSLRHPGSDGTAPIQFTELAIEMEDNSYQTVIFSEAFETVEVIHRGNVAATLTGGALDAGFLVLTLASPIILGPGDTDTLDLVVDVRSEAQLRQLRLVIADSTQMVARNFSTGQDVPVSLDTGVMPPGATFPLYSGWIQMRYPAQSPLACLSWIPGVAYLAGADTVSLMSLVFTYPASDDFSPLRVWNVSVIVLDTTDLALDPRLLFDRLGYTMDGSPAQYQLSVNPVNGQTVFEFGDEGILVQPSDTVTIQLVADLDAGVPYDHFVLHLESLEAIAVTDATDPSVSLQVLPDAECGCTVPCDAGPISILWPAGRPTLHPESVPLLLAAAGQENVQVFDAILDYASLVPRGDLLLESFSGEIFRRTADGLSPISGSTVFSSVRLKIDEQTWANDSSLASSTTLLWSDSDYRLEPSTSARFQLEVDIKSNAPPGNYVLRFGDSTFITFVDENVDTSLYPLLATGSYPLLSTELSIMAADLKGSFTNYPNPFIPSRDDGVTTFGYFLSEDARVTLDLYTTTGELVVTVINDVLKGAGNHVEDTWDGRNDRGLAVAPGTYLGVITARYNSGRQESARRKVTVVR